MKKTTILPTDRNAVRLALWKFLKDKLNERRRLCIPLGSLASIPLRVRRMPSDGFLDSKHPGDISLDIDGKLALAEILGIWADDIPDPTDTLPVLLDEIYELVRMGILRPFPSGHYLFITEHGSRCLDSDGGFCPLDSMGRVDAFRQEFASSPQVELMASYLAEAIEAVRHGLLLASATMIGCAYELAMLELAGAVLTRWHQDCSRIPGLDKDERRVLQRVKDKEPASIASLESALFKALSSDRSNLGANDWDWAESGMRATFVLVRKLRNTAGHPTGARVAGDDVWTHILLLPEWYRHLRSIIDRLSTQEDPA